MFVLMVGIRKIVKLMCVGILVIVGMVAVTGCSRQTFCHERVSVSFTREASEKIINGDKVITIYHFLPDVEISRIEYEFVWSQEPMVRIIFVLKNPGRRSVLNAVNSIAGRDYVLLASVINFDTQKPL